MFALRALPAGGLALALGACTADSGARYQEYATALSEQGGLRTEANPEDAPYTNADLAWNFERIALFREYRREGPRLIQVLTPTRLSRWDDPIRYRLVGLGVTEADRKEYAALALRLHSLTGLSIEETKGDDPNLSILILSLGERRAFIEALRIEGAAERMPLVMQWAEDVSYPCIGQVGYKDAESGEISGAMIFIKAELEGVLRRSCIHEELAQTLGLLNDDLRVRPSIFNDDQEFALLTDHDEYLLEILYDPRLEAGMDAEQAMPLARAIIEELRPEGES